MALAKSLIWSLESEQDLEGILKYLESNWPIAVVQDFVSDLFDKLDWIAEGRDGFMAGTESGNICKYVLSVHHTLYFEVFTARIHLLRIFDTRQNPSKLRL
jgi:plasmid stabilization system protein ParE